MADYRTKRQKLEAMANQTESPHEAEVAKKKLAAMGVEPPAAKQRARTLQDILYEDILREAEEQMARSFRRTSTQYYYGWFGREFGFGRARPSGWEGQGTRPEYIYSDDVFTAEDLRRAQQSMGTKPPQTGAQAEAMYNEIRRRLDEAETLSRDEWRSKYGRKPLFDEEQDDE